MNLYQAEDLLRDLMYQHGLIQQGWKLKFDKAVRRLGYCNYSKRVISLARHATLANDEATVRNTCLHEIAHALLGYGFGHGPVWKAKFLSIGGNGERCSNIAVAAQYKWQMNCKDCGYTWKYYRKPAFGPCYIHKCQKLLQRIGYVRGTPWKPVGSNLHLEALI